MDTIKNYSLYVERIDNAIADFVSRQGDLLLEIDKSDETKIICRIKQGKSIGVINFYNKINGLISISIQGAASLKELCNRCCEFVIQQTSIPNSLRKSFTIRNSKKNNLELFKLELTDTHKLQITDKEVCDNTTIKERFIVQSVSDICVTCTLYNNATFLLQGNVTTLFLTVLTECLRWLVDETQINTLPEIISFQNITQVFSENIKDLVPNLNVSGDDDGVIERMILTSVTLFNSGIIVDDYGCYTFGVLKALEGILKLRLSEDLGTIETLGDYYSFNQSSHRHCLTTTAYDSDLELKKALNKGYNIWASSRHSSFHADDQISTSTLLSYEQAYEVFINTIECINCICDNWK